MKQRISLTIDEKILRQVDALVDNPKVKNRSHAVELLLARSLGNHVPKIAVILAGGKGTRLRPLTYEIPKALIPIHGKTLTEHIFDLFKKYEIRNIILALGHMKNKIRKYFEDGVKYGIKLNYIEENEPLGTAGPLKLGRGLLKETFIVSNGDELKNINITEMYELHKQKKALVTIALTTIDDPQKYGVARLSGSRILEFTEKPRKGKAFSNLINSGFYIIEPEVIDIISDGFAMLEKDVFPKLAAQGRLYGYPFSGQWFDTGNIERYEKAIKEWKDIA